MSLLPSFTVLEKAALAGAEAAHFFASVLNTQHQTFWKRNVDEILAELNANVARNLAIFELNTKAGKAVNELLDALGDERFSNRAPITMPPNWSFENGAFAYIEPTPEIEAND
jgi:hypothetical protein